MEREKWPKGDGPRGWPLGLIAWAMGLIGGPVFLYNQQRIPHEGSLQWGLLRFNLRGVLLIICSG
jgi:hypothetical protein